METPISQSSFCVMLMERMKSQVNSSSEKKQGETEMALRRVFEGCDHHLTMRWLHRLRLRKRNPFIRNPLSRISIETKVGRTYMITRRYTYGYKSFVFCKIFFYGRFTRVSGSDNRHKHQASEIGRNWTWPLCSPNRVRATPSPGVYQGASAGAELGSHECLASACTFPRKLTGMTLAIWISYQNSHVKPINVCGDFLPFSWSAHVGTFQNIAVMNTQDPQWGAY